MSKISTVSQSNDGNNSDLFILIDGHSLAFRAYYAFATSRQGALRTSQGIPTSICFGFLNSLTQVIESQKPTYLAVAFDRGEPTFRHQADTNYKADRKETPEDFIPDLNNLLQLLSALNISIVTFPGYEADDILATLASRASQEGYQVKILTGDRDLFQLVDRNKKISVLYLDNQGIKSATGVNHPEFDPEAVEAKLGIKPEQVVDYKALCGDKSDNIPGIRGIGDKTAVKLLQEYGTLEAIYQNLVRIQGAVKKKLEAGKADAEHSRYLAQIISDVPVELELKNCQLTGFDPSKVIPWLEKLELKKLLKNIDRLQQNLGGDLEVKEKTISQSELDSSENQQLSLFNLDTPGLEVNKNLNYSDNNSLDIRPQIIDTEAKLNDLINILDRHQNIPIAWDTETSSLEPRDAELVGIGCCWGDNITDLAYIPLAHSQGTNLDKQLAISALRPILESNNYAKIFQNTKFDRLVLLHHDIKLTGVVFDTMLASYIINPEQSHNLTELSRKYLSGIVAKSYKDLEIPKGKSIADLDIETVANYCGLDAFATFKLAAKLQTKLASIPELSKLLLEIEQPLESVLAEMEVRGIRLDTVYLKQLSQQLNRDLVTIELQVYEDAGEKFNLDSPKQLSEILFDRLNLSRKKSRKTKTGYSTNHTVLEKLQGDHPIVDRILDYRTLAKLKSTYVDALPNLVRSDTQRVHTDFNQTNTTTGRLSSSNPNLQNIPIRTEFSRQIRQAFIPEDNWLLVTADYSQIELRILTHLSQEPILEQAYRNQEDVHTVTAKLIFEKENITPEERRLGKIINFGVIYGMGSQRFARESGLTALIGKEFIDKYRQRYAKVFAYLETVKKEAIANGFVTTILGRRRYFDFESNSLKKLLGTNPEEINLEKLDISYYDTQLLRAAANAPIQGSSADIIKIAMVKLQQVLQKYQARLLLQVHDELVLEIPPEELSELKTKIKQIMENAVSLRIPLVVDIHAGKNWMEAK